MSYDPPATDLSDLMSDEQHIAAALYMLTRAAAGRNVLPDPSMHALLRDAAMHAEAARRYWTKEERDRLDEIGREFFGETRVNPHKPVDAGQPASTGSTT